MKFLTRLTRFLDDARGPVEGKPGTCAYAIGDVHGRDDLLADVLTKIADDHAARGHVPGYLVLLGDLIDRGPASAQVIERVRTLALPGLEPVCLMGNHEEALLGVLDKGPRYLHDWLSYGGDACATSYGLDPAVLRRIEPEAAAAALRRAVPAEHQRFLHSLVDSFRWGDYLFAHAGIRPGVPLAAQVSQDLRWIRAPFLEDTSDHGVVVVHGHTITDRVVSRPNRIGLDTGAYRSGRLSAAGFAGQERWFLESDRTNMPTVAADQSHGLLEMDVCR